MTPDRIVTSLALAKKLKEVGFPQEDCSHYYADTRESWKEFNCNPPRWPHDELVFVPFENCDLNVRLGEIELHHSQEEAASHSRGYNQSQPLAAPTAAELLERLPEYTEVQRYGVGYRARIPHLGDWTDIEETPQDALAALILSHNLLP